MKHLLVLLFITCMFACNESSVKKDSDDKLLSNNSYPKEISSQYLKSIYDKTKWLIFCIHCDEVCRFYKKLNIVDTPYFSSLDLKFDRIETFGDSVEVSFYFYYKNSVKCDVNSVYNHGVLTYGAGYKQGSDSVLYYLSHTTVNRFYEWGPNSRYDNPIQPDVISFLNMNKDKLNPWLREEAKRRGVIK